MKILKSKIFLLTVSTSIVYAVMLFLTIPYVMSFSGGMKLLDMMPMGYTTPYVLELLSALGETGRSAYLYRQLPLDFLYPGLFAITLFYSIQFFLVHFRKEDSYWKYSTIFPIIAGLSDYIENIFFFIFFRAFPNIDSTLVQISSLFSVTKAISTSITFTIVLIFLLIVGGNKVVKVFRKYMGEKKRI